LRILDLKKIVLLSLVAISAIYAADKDKSDEFITHTELSYVQTQGNTNTNAFSLDFAGDKAWDKHSLKLDLDILYGSDDNVETKNKLLTELNYDYLFAKHFSVNYLVGYKYDRFSGFEYQFYTGPGIKYIPFDNKVHKLDFQGNILYNMDETMDKYYDANGDEIKYPYPDGTDGATLEKGESDDYIGYSLKLNYDWQIIESLKFVQELSYRSDFDDSDNYFAFSKTAFEVKISDIFSMGISYKVDYTNLPPSEKEYADRTFMTSLIIDY
jgi:putative salt-induced outer membrane protein